MKPKSKGQYAEFVEHIEFPTIIYIYESGRVIGQNRRAREILGNGIRNMSMVWAEQRKQKVSRELLEYSSWILYNRDVIIEGRALQIDMEMNTIPLDKEHLVICFFERSHKQQFVRFLQVLIPRLYVKNHELRYLLTNRVFDKDAGMVSFQGKRDRDILEPFFSQMNEKEELELMEEKQCSYSLQQMIRTSSQKVFYGRLNRIPLVNKGGESIGLIGVYNLVPGRDEYKRMFDSLLKENNLLNETISKSDVVVISWFDEEGWPVDYISPNFNKLGFTARDFYDRVKCWRDIIHSEDYERIRAESLKNQGSVPFAREYRLVRTDGSSVLVRDEIVKKWYNGIAYLQGTLAAASAEKAEEFMIEMENSPFRKYQSFLSGIPEGLPAHRIRQEKETHLEKNLRNAIRDGYVEFDIYYQPIVDSRSKRICGAEALIRWRNPELGFVKPMDFIPLSEYLGLIVPLGNYVIREVFKTSRMWKQVLGRTFPISINLSVVQLVQADVVESICSIAKELKADCRDILFEVTESLAVEDIELMKNVLQELKEQSFGIALDDFGTGYSSLSHIMEMPLDFIKIDKSFIANYGTKKFNPSLLSAVIEMAHGMNMEVIVEGVETKQQMEFLMFLNADKYQGYLFGKPMPKQEFCEMFIEKQ